MTVLRPPSLTPEQRERLRALREQRNSRRLTDAERRELQLLLFGPAWRAPTADLVKRGPER